MPIGNLQVGSYKNVTATGNIQAQDGALIGFLTATTSSGTLIFYDSATTTTTVPITGTITPAAGSYTPLPVCFNNGLYVVVGGTINITLVFAA